MGSTPPPTSPPPAAIPPVDGDVGARPVPPPRQRPRVAIRRALADLFGSGELLMTFVERDLRVRYRQAVLGVAWAVLQPLLLMVVFTVVFGRIAHVGSEGAPYAVFAYTALVPWGFLADSVIGGSNSIITNAAMVRKLYLPREIFPLSSVLSSTVDSLISSVILVGLLLAYGYGPSVEWVALPLLALGLGLFAVALTMAASAVTVYFRDVRFGLPFVFQILLFSAPVAYPLQKELAALPAGLRDLYAYLNPLVPLIEGFRRVLVHQEWPQWGPLTASIGIAAVSLALVYRWYKRIDGTFADVI